MNKAEELQVKFIKNGWTLALAESCTGGALSARLVEIPDASLYFLGSIVAYSNRAKMDLLGVKKETLEQFGAVSKETAIEMALGTREHFKSTVAFSVTGIAGPDGGTRKVTVHLTLLSSL